MTGKEWNYRKFWKYVLPSVLSMAYISLFVMVDSLFVARYVGTKALAAVSITHPIYNLTLSIAIMLSVGGSALISIALGEGNKERANNDFSVITLAIIIVVSSISIMGLSNLDGFLKLLGVTSELHKYALVYARILFLTMPFLGLKASYEFFLRVDDCPNLSLALTVTGGTINMVFDYIFVARLGWGIAGAGYATMIGIAIPPIIGAVHFFFRSKHIRYIKPKFDGKFLFDASINGSSEMVSELSVAITAVLLNGTLIRYAGAPGVAANSVLMYTFSIYASLVFGLNMGIQPAVSFSYGTGNHDLIRDIMKKAFIVVSCFSVSVFIFVQVFGEYLIGLFLKKDSSTLEMALQGMRIFSSVILVGGLNILASGYLTSINKGKVSAIISFSRSFVVFCPAIIILPLLLQLNGIWIAKPLAEFITLMITVYFIKRERNVQKNRIWRQEGSDQVL